MVHKVTNLDLLLFIISDHLFLWSLYHESQNFWTFLFVNADKVTNVGLAIIPTIGPHIEYGPFYIVKCQRFGLLKKAQHFELFKKEFVSSAKVTNLDLLLFIISDH